MSAPFYSVPPTYAPPASPYYAPTSQQHQPPTSSPVEQAILNLSKLVDNFIEDQRAVDVQTNQLVHQEEENLEKECILREQAQMQPQGELMQEPIEAPEELPAREAWGGRGKGAGEEHQRLTLHPIPINLDPSVTAQPKNNPLPVNILLAAQPTPEAPTGKATPFALPALQNFRKSVATAQIFATTSKKMAAAHTAWHSGWFGCWFGFGALEPQHF